MRVTDELLADSSRVRTLLAAIFQTRRQNHHNNVALRNQPQSDSYSSKLSF